MSAPNNPLTQEERDDLFHAQRCAAEAVGTSLGYVERWAREHPGGVACEHEIVDLHEKLRDYGRSQARHAERVLELLEISKQRRVEAKR